MHTSHIHLIFIIISHPRAFVKQIRITSKKHTKGAAMPPLPTVSLYGIPYVNTSPEALHEHLRASLLTPTLAPTVIFTPNAAIAAAAKQDAALTTLLRRATLCLPDGIGVLAAARRCGTPIRQRLPGIEAGEQVLHLAAAYELPVFFLGAAPGVARRAAAQWKQRLPSLPIAGTHHGYFEKEGEQNDRLLARIRDSGARIVLVCFGFPAQERWINQNVARLPNVRMLLALGGSFNVWAGDVRRAPRLLRRLHLEWLWRILCDPSKLHRLPIMISFVRQAKKGKKR
jgi:N-acetylglucosaminyldiphosphoundecaprenol N-acetyl-beta-D-mannosaminyltransferase